MASVSKASADVTAYPITVTSGCMRHGLSVNTRAAAYDMHYLTNMAFVHAPLRGVRRLLPDT